MAKNEEHSDSMGKVYDSINNIKSKVNSIVNAGRIDVAESIRDEVYDMLDELETMIENIRDER